MLTLMPTWGLSSARRGRRPPTPYFDPNLPFYYTVTIRLKKLTHLSPGWQNRLATGLTIATVIQSLVTPGEEEMVPGEITSLSANTLTADSQYFISSGVRRSLASQMNGATEIPATIVQAGQADIQTTLNLDQLFSPKFEMPADSRLLNIQPPIRVPIEVQPLGIPGQPASIPLNQVKIVSP